jgi:gas vesicle protein GvpG
VILFKLLALPITAPAAGIRYCIDKVVEYAEHQLTDDEPVRQELLELHLQLEEGQIGEEEFAEREAVLHARLREIREYRKEQAREQSGDSAPRPPDEEKRSFVIEIPEELE